MTVPLGSVETLLARGSAATPRQPSASTYLNCRPSEQHGWIAAAPGPWTHGSVRPESVRRVEYPFKTFGQSCFFRCRPDSVSGHCCQDTPESQHHGTTGGSVTMDPARRHRSRSRQPRSSSRGQLQSRLVHGLVHGTPAPPPTNNYGTGTRHETLQVRRQRTPDSSTAGGPPWDTDSRLTTPPAVEESGVL